MGVLTCEHAHGTGCTTCLNRFQSTFGSPGELECLDEPAAIVDRDMNVLSANGQFTRLAESLEGTFAGLRLGEVLRCTHSREGHHCGEGPLCDRCSLRRLAEITRISGEQITAIEVTVTQENGSETSWSCSTTRKGDDIVLSLRVTGQCAR